MLEKLARSELLSTFFPTWLWQGREWSKWRIPKYDLYYWVNAYAHPVISTFYPSGIISSFLSQKVSLDKGFILLVFNIILHRLFEGAGWYLLVSLWSNALIGIFGAITFTLAGYNWKQQPCFQYTIAWFPWLLLGIAKCSTLLAGVSFGMILLAGYYPIGIQIALVAGLATIYWKCPPYWIPIGLLIGSVQLIPFLKYLPKTIRTNKVSNIGKVPWWHFSSLVFPKAFRFYINGVGHWETSYYIGIIPLLTIWYTTSRAVVLVILATWLMLGLFSRHLPRIPARWSFTFQFSLIWCALSGLNNLNLPNTVLFLLCLIQAFDLLTNNLDLLIIRPYSELWNRPSHAFNTRLTRFLEAESTKKGIYRVSGLPYPLFTGHVNRIRTLGYSGGMQLKLMAKWRNDNNPDGGGAHDFFKGGGNPDDLTRYRVKFAYCASQPLNWERTDIPRLWRNPKV